MWLPGDEGTKAIEDKNTWQTATLV
jgi:hypothetical protein